MRILSLKELVARSSSPDVGDALRALAIYGKPALMLMDGNHWHCSLALHVTVAGTTLDVRSGFKHEQPEDAVYECGERLAEILGQLRQIVGEPIEPSNV